MAGLQGGGGGVEDHSELTGVGSGDHHSKTPEYTDSDAESAIGRSLTLVATGTVDYIEESGTVATAPDGTVRLILDSGGGYDNIYSGSTGVYYIGSVSGEGTNNGLSYRVYKE